MAEEKIVTLQENFYYDSFSRVIIIMTSLCVAIGLLICLSIYLYLDKPKPATFMVDPEWRIQPAVPVNEAYLPTSDMLQWVSDVVRKVFIYDFYNYDKQVKANSIYFTTEGWQIFLNQLNIYANYNNVKTYKLFMNATPASAPFVLQKGLLSGRYAWWVQMPVDLNYISFNRAPTSQTLTLQLLVVRVPTLDNLFGISIDNVIVAKASGKAAIGTSNV